MDFSLSNEQSAISDSVRRYCREQYGFDVRQKIAHSSEGCSLDQWKKFADMGWIGLALPASAGGLGGGIIETSILLQEFGRSLVLEPYLACAVLTAQALRACVPQERQAEAFAPILNGERIVVLAHSETESRGEITYVRTQATQQNDGTYVLNGHKSLVLGGTCASSFLVSARTSGEGSDRDGISLFHVPRDAHGVQCRNYRTLDAHTACDVTLTDTIVSADALCGSEGCASDAIEHAIQHAIVAVCAEAVGCMESVIEKTKEHLKTRQAYGNPLSSYQALQHRLADMLMEFELSRSMLFRVMSILESDDAEERRRAVSAAKAMIGQSGRFVGSNGIQLHGGMGMSDEYVIGHYFKRLTVIDVLFGNSDFHTRRFGAQ